MPKHSYKRYKMNRNNEICAVSENRKRNIESFAITKLLQQEEAKLRRGGANTVLELQQPKPKVERLVVSPGCSNSFNKTTLMVPSSTVEITGKA